MHLNKEVIKVEKKTYESAQMKIVFFGDEEVLAASGFYTDDDDPNGLPIAPAEFLFE